MAAHRKLWHKGLQRCALLTRKLGLETRNYTGGQRCPHSTPRDAERKGGRTGFFTSSMGSEPIKRYVPLVEASCCDSSLVMTLKPTGDPFSGSPL